MRLYAYIAGPTVIILGRLKCDYKCLEGLLRSRISPLKHMAETESLGDIMVTTLTSFYISKGVEEIKLSSVV